MKTVLDANIFVSALLRGGNPLAVTQRAARGLDKLFFTDAIINEVERVLKKPKLHLGEYDVKRIVTRVEHIGKKVSISPQRRVKGVCRDPKDDMYLECAIAAGADYIISGDNDLLVLKEYGGVKIVNARSYLDIVSGG
jgi:uncharacterized protein